MDYTPLFVLITSVKDSGIFILSTIKEALVSTNAMPTCY